LCRVWPQICQLEKQVLVQVRERKFINAQRGGVRISVQKELKIYAGEIAASSTKTARKTG
jgi:hypothetical protein